MGWYQHLIPPKLKFPNKQESLVRDGIYNNVVLNPNAKALVVPLEEGGTEGDNNFGSIGDATQRHVLSISHGERQLWEGLILSRNGNIFRTEPSTAWHDTDPFSLRGKELDDYFVRLAKTAKKEGDEPTEEELKPIREAFEEEAKRREQSQDVYDHAELIPYSQMEQFPGLMKHVEVPTTPKDLLIYVGNVNDIFYDEFPDGYQDAKVMRNALSILNQPWENIDEGYTEWFCEWVESQEMTPFTAKCLKVLANYLRDGERNPLEVTEAMLKAVDSHWRAQYKKQADERNSKDIIYQLLKKNLKGWLEEAKQGKTVYPRVKAFGQLLWKEYREEMKSHHWALYRKIKKEFVPRVLLRGVDINRCSMDELRRLFKVEWNPHSSNEPAPFDIARKVWHERPFEGIGELRAKGCLTAKVYADEDKSAKILEGMDVFYEKSKTAKSTRPLDIYREKMIQAQRGGSKLNWSPLWAYYNILKKELSSFLEQEKQHEQEAVG